MTEALGENRAYKPLSNCFYGGAFPHCLVHSEEMVRVSGDFLPKLDFHIGKDIERYLVCKL